MKFLIEFIIFKLEVVATITDNCADNELLLFKWIN